MLYAHLAHLVAKIDADTGQDLKLLRASSLSEFLDSRQLYLRQRFLIDLRTEHERLKEARHLVHQLRF